MFNLNAAQNAEHTRITFTTSQNLRIDMCGDRSNGTRVCQQEWVEGNGEITLWQAPDNIIITLRDEEGCHRNIGGLPEFVTSLPEH